MPEPASRPAGLAGLWRECGSRLLLILVFRMVGYFAVVLGIAILLQHQSGLSSFWLLVIVIPLVELFMSTLGAAINLTQRLVRGPSVDEPISPERRQAMSAAMLRQSVLIMAAGLTLLLVALAWVHFG